MEELWQRREATIRDLPDALYPDGGSSLAPLLTYLVEAGELTAKERTHLRTLLDEPQAKRRRPKTRKP